MRSTSPTFEVVQFLLKDRVNSLEILLFLKLNLLKAKLLFPQLHFVQKLTLFMQTSDLTTLIHSVTTQG